MSDIPTSDWSELAASNIQPAPAGWPSLSSPNIVYSTDREMMGAIKREFNRGNATVTSTGSANAQVLTFTSPPAAMVRGMRFSFIAGFQNTSAATLAISPLAPVAIQANGAALIGGELRVGLVAECIYDGTNFQIIASSGGTIARLGSSTNDSAAAGYVGEYIQSIATSPGITLPTGSVGNVSNVSLTAGDWDVTGEVWISIGTGGATNMYAAIGTTSGTMPGGPGSNASRVGIVAALTAGSTQILPVSTTRVSLASTTSVYLLGLVTYPSGTVTAYGRIGGRRAR